MPKHSSRCHRKVILDELPRFSTLDQLNSLHAGLLDPVLVALKHSGHRFHDELLDGFFMYELEKVNKVGYRTCLNCLVTNPVPDDDPTRRYILRIPVP